MGNNLQHHGIPGQKWGVRRYQNSDGSLTSLGRKRISSIRSTQDDPEIVKKLKDRGINGSESRSFKKIEDQLKDKTKSDGQSIKQERNKKIALAGVGIATVAASAYYVHKNPERIGQVMAQFKGVKVKDISQKAVDKGKEYVEQAIKNAKDDIKESAKGAKDGFREGLREAPKKAVKTVVTGVVLNETKKALDSTIGKEESARIFQANDNKKIGKFWKVSPEDKDDED